VVPQEPEPPAQAAPPVECEATCTHHRPVRLSWAKLLKRVFEIDMAHCPNSETDQVQPGAWHQRSQPLHELQRRHHQVRGAVAPSGLELEHDLPGRVGLHALVGQSGARDVAAQLLQRLAVVGTAAHGGMQAEALDVGAQSLLEVRVPGHGTLQRQHLLAGAACKARRLPAAA